uniref:UbiA family prenyltransferase n=1 Tax=uncultured Nevskia sp. TaxID=228950 RepID=UPI0025E8DE54
FDYAGDVADDLPVWRASRNAIVTGHLATSYRRIEKTTPVIEVYADPADVWLHYLKALRPQQWIKNLLVFLPLVAAHRLFEPAPLMKVVLAFAAVTACASSVYLLNDLLDLSSDRHHPHKRKRMLASGAIGTGGACWLMGTLLVSAIAIGFALSPLFLLVLLSYYLMTLAYSLGLKDRVVLDVLILAGGYAARVAAGAVAIGIAPSSWMLAFCVFLFFSLALIKRFSELVLRRRLDGPKAQARAYVIDDAGVIAAQGIASGYLAVLVLALYTTTDLIQSLYGRYWLFWGICVLLLYWISYLWLAADRGRIEDDPVSFAIKDRVSRNLLLGIAAIGLAAT